MLTTTELFDVAALTAIRAAAGLLGSDMEAGLFVGAVTPSKILTVADLTEASYSGYARQPCVMGAPYRDPQVGIASLSGALTWQQTGTPVPQTITGIFYTYNATGLLLGVEVFSAPIALNDLLDAFDTILEYIQSSENAGYTTIVR